MPKENCEQIFEIKDKAVVTIIKEITKDGLKIQYNSMGQVTGKYNAMHIETVDIVQKMDGTNTWESRAVDTTKEGEIVVVSGKGIGKMTSFQGEYNYMTNSPKLAWLNSTKAFAEGTNDMTSGSAEIKVYAVKEMAKASAVM